MPNLCKECNNPCNCTMQNDGIVFYNGEYLVNSGKGRRSTVVAGSGTDNDPYTVSFIDSEFYRPVAGERGLPDQSVPTTGTLPELKVGSNSQIVYSTPTLIFIPTTDETLNITADFIMIGFSVTVQGSGSTGNHAKLLINFIDEPFDIQSIGAYTTETNNSFSQVLTTVGFVPGRFTQPGAGGPPIGFENFEFIVDLTENVGQKALSNIRVWVASL